MHDERHVLPGPGGWSVKATGARRPSSRHSNPRDAVRHARRTLHEDGGEILIHGRDGDVRARVMYPPRTNRRVHPAKFR